MSDSLAPSHATTAFGRSCPDVGVLQDFNDGRLPLALQDSISDHIARCPLCQSVLANLTQWDELPHLRLPPGGPPSEASAAVTAAGTARERVGLLATPGAASPRVVGQYELLEEIGRGGMGVVFKARQKGTEQLVALKMLHPAWALAPDEGGRAAIAQFLLEARAAARLRHPNRVRILHMAEHEGEPFYAMELIDGCSLAEKAQQPGGLSKAAAVKYLAGVAEAFHEAHQHDIIHRDIKPRNILIDRLSDEALLADFGLAQMGSSSPGQEPSGGAGAPSRLLLGTLPYMPPEQTRGADRVTKASDIYSLGATLYELLTGRPPFRAANRQQLIDDIRHKEPIPPRQRGCNVGRALEQICLKCLHKGPDQRYGTALELAQALRGYLHEVHHARRFSSMGAYYIGLGPVVLLINLAVFLMIRAGSPEPLIWLVLFCMYPALFGVFVLAPPSTAGREHYLSRLEIWSVWGGKLFAAVAISVTLRLVLSRDLALVLVYPVFAALSGMAVFSVVSKMSKKLWPLAGGCCMLGMTMLFNLEWAPLFYGVYSMMGLVLFGVYLRMIGRELQ